jgi:hypothetical protein
MTKNTTNQIAPAKSELENQETKQLRALSAADFKPYFPESSGNFIILFGENSLTLAEDKGFKPSTVIPYNQVCLDFVRQQFTVAITDSFPKVDAPNESIQVIKKAVVTGGYLLATSLNGSLERSSTNFYTKSTGKDDVTGKALKGNTTEAGLERVAAAMSANDLSPATFGQTKKTAFVWAKFIADTDKDTKAGGPLNAKLDTWLATKKRYPTSRLLEAAILKLHREHGSAYWLTAPLIQAGYTEPAEIESESLADLL